MPNIQFEGVTHSFPDDFTDDDIATALSQEEAKQTNIAQGTSAMADGIMQPELAEDDGEEPITLSFAAPRDVPLPTEVVEIDNELQNPIVLASKPDLFTRSTDVAMNKKEGTFRDKIANLETGGLDNDFIRTRVKPKKGSAGSSAFGTFQITRGLLRSTLRNKAKLFTEPEQAAMAKLINLQSIALAIGGVDRKKYEKGGRSRSQAEVWAKGLKFETVDDFLNAFDYGGDYGLSKDVAFKAQYENFGRKMLNSVLKQAKGNAPEAASIWHGGKGWRKAKSKSDTKKYRSKFESLTLEGTATSSSFNVVEFLNQFTTE